MAVFATPLTAAYNNNAAIQIPLVHILVDAVNYFFGATLCGALFARKSGWQKTCDAGLALDVSMDACTFIAFDFP